MGRRYFAVAMVIAAVAFWGYTATAWAQKAGGGPALEKGAVEQLRTAIQHSGFSQNYDNVQTAKQHLQHVVNCVEGQRGPMYDGGAGNPCEGKGNGAMTDAKAAGGKMTATATWLELANDIAVTGIKAKDINKVKAAGWATQVVLEHAAKDVR